LRRGIPFIIHEDRSPEQALAIVELLDDWREVIWNRYQLPLQELLRDQRGLPEASDSKSINETDLPF